jgi:hypothetical protein
VVGADETSVLYTLTFEAAVMRHCLGQDGDDDGMNVVVVVVVGGGGGGGGGLVMVGAKRVLDGFPGLLDGDDRDLCNSVGTHVGRVLGWIVRLLLMMIPRGWVPAAEPYGGVAEISLGGDGESCDPVARITWIFQDPDGTDFSTITSVTNSGGKLYLGCLHCDYLGVLSLD